MWEGVTKFFSHLFSHLTKKFSHPFSHLTKKFSRLFSHPTITSTKKKIRMSSSSAIEEATTTTVNTPPYKRVCCDQLFTSYQNFYRHRKRKHGEDISKRKQGQEEKRELIEKQRQETYQRKLEFIVMNAKKEEAKSTIVFIAEKMKMKLTPSLDLIPGLDAKVTSHPFTLTPPPV